jgi:transposase-like protein
MEAARNLGLKVKMLGRWTRQAEQQTNGSLGGNGHLTADHEARLRLRKENQRLRMTREM